MRGLYNFYNLINFLELFLGEDKNLGKSQSSRPPTQAPKFANRWQRLRWGHGKPSEQRGNQGKNKTEEKREA